MEDVVKEHEEDKLHQFLMGLDKTLFGSVKSALFSQVPLPTLDEVYNAVSQDEESMTIRRIIEELAEGVSFVVQSQILTNNNGYARNTSMVCPLW